MLAVGTAIRIVLAFAFYGVEFDQVSFGLVAGAISDPEMGVYDLPPYRWPYPIGFLPFVGLIEHTNLVAPERYGGRHFLYVANYRSPDDPILTVDADELLSRFLPGIRKVNPSFSPSWVRQRWLFREPAAQPIVTVGYRERIPPVETPVPGLLLANTTQIYPEDRGTNYSVRLGSEAVEALLAQRGE